MIHLLGVIAGAVTGGAVLGTFEGPVDGAVLGTIEGTVDRTVIERFDSASRFYGMRIVLNGREVPQRDLLGPVVLEESLDDPIRTASFSVVGAAYSVFRTTDTWTRVPVDIYFSQGPEDDVAEELVFRGYVLTGKPTGELEPVVTISCGDAGALFKSVTTCAELEPLLGLTRGVIVTDVLLEAGVAGVSVPDGARYEKSVQAVNKPLLPWVKEFGEPEGWYWRFRNDQVAEAFVPTFRHPPLAPHHTWSVDDIHSLSVEPPSDCPSRYVGRCFGPVIVDELGQVTTITETEEQTIYAPKVATLEQQTDGSRTATGATLNPATLRVTKRIRNEQTKTGSLVTRDYTAEWGWFNPPAAAFETVLLGAGPAPGGFDWLVALIDEAGEFVAWSEERFVLRAERLSLPEYDVDGTLVGSVTQNFEYFRQVTAAKSGGLWLAGVAVGSDGMSYVDYAGTIEIYGLASVETDVRTYDLGGAEAQRVTEKETYYAKRGPLGDKETADGQGLEEETAFLQLTERLTTTNVKDTSGLLAGRIDTKRAWSAPKASNGANDWGPFLSNAETESFTDVEVKSTRFDVITEDTYEETVTTGDGAPVTTVRSGRRPQPRYKASPWTRLVQQPIDFVLDDPVVEQWFGFSREVVNNDYCQSAEELRRLIEHRRDRQLTTRLSVRRVETLASIGDTVAIEWPPAGLAARAMITRISRPRDLQALPPVATYELEVPIATGPA